MTTLRDMMRKARIAVVRRGVAPEDADDLVQEAFLRLEQYRQTTPIRLPEAMLVRSAVNLSIDEGRRQKRSPIDRTMTLIEGYIEDAPGADHVIEARERLRHANEGIAKLPDQTRRVFLARRVDGLSYAEIARQEQLTVRAAQERVARATLSLMKWMEQW